MDRPNERSSHVRPTPRGGGLAIVAVFIASTAVFAWWKDFALRELLAVLFCGGLVAGIGYWDDRVDLSARSRILVHLLAAVCAVWLLGGFPELPLGAGTWSLGWAGWIVAVLFLVWMLNLYNFMDGIDGIAAGEAITVLGSVLLIKGLETGSLPWGASLDSMQWLFLCATAGFLCWNWPPARIFMGDVSSGFMGFVLGVFALQSAHLDQLGFWTWLILLGWFICDSTLTLLRRVFRGERWYEAHRSHAYQHLAIGWKSHLRSTGVVLATNLLWLLPLAYAAETCRGSAWWITLLALAPLSMALLLSGAGQPDPGPLLGGRLSWKAANRTSS